MFQTSRRQLLQTLFSAPSMLAVARFLPQGLTDPAIATGFLNVNLRGPFSFIFFASKNQVLIIAPDSLNHHLPLFSSVNSEAPIQRADYVLVGANPTSAPQPAWVDPSVKRLNIEAKVLKMDSGGTIDQGRQRFFSIWLPMPDFIAPWHPISIAVTGSDSPYSPSTPVKLPVGYTFIYQNTLFSQVQIKCPANSNYDWKPQLMPYPTQNTTDILIEMASSLDVDCKHKSATAAFSDECSLFAGVNPGVKLDLGLYYGPPDANCPALAKSLNNQKRPRSVPAIQPTSTGHTGTDCKAALLEIVNTSNSVTLGT